MGGLKMYDTMARAEADLFIHTGDTVYADQPVLAEMRAGDGTTFKNLTTEAKSKVAETLDEFRGQWEYNLLDENFRVQRPVRPVHAVGRSRGSEQLVPGQIKDRATRSRAGGCPARAPGVLRIQSDRESKRT
jgi:hypothetical protein